MALQAPTDNLDTKLITPEATANLLGLSLATLTIWRATGRYNLPYVKVGRLVRYKLSDVESFIERRSRQHTGENKDKNDNPNKANNSR